MSDRREMPIREIVRLCLAMLPADQRRWWLAVPLLAMLTGAAEAGAAAAVFGLITIVGDPARAPQMPIAAWVAAGLPPGDSGGLVLRLTALVAAYHIGKNLLIVMAQYVRHRIVGGSSAALASTLLQGYLLAPYPFHFRRHSADLIRNTTHSVDAVCTALSSAAAVLSELFVGAGIIAVLLAAAPGVTVITGGVLAVVTALLLRAMRRLAERSGRATHDLSREMLQTLQHALGAIKEIKALGREGFFYRAYAEQQRQRLALGYLSVTLETLPPLVIETVFVCGALSVIAFLTATGKSGGGGLPLLALFAYAGFRIVPMANRVTWRLNEVRGQAAAVRAVYDDYQLVSGPAAADTAELPLNFRDAIALTNVAYTYPGSDAPSLRDVSLTIRHGESLGIFGPTGAGKSTLVDLIVGLLPPSQGRITVDGVALGDGRERTWRRHIGYVPQTIVLLDDSLRRNVALGIPDREIDERRLRSAIGIAQLDELVAGLPQGLDTPLGERGVRLSGGERQRVGIARALYHDPDVVVLDEATAALDAATEAALSGALRALHGVRTVLVITHRLATVRACQRIALIADGRLADCGTYDELLARSPELRRLAAPAAPAMRSA